MADSTKKVDPSQFDLFPSEAVFDSNDLEIRNTKDSRCPICNIPALAKYDGEIFYRRMHFEEFLPEANNAGYHIPVEDFKNHARKHIYVYKPSKFPSNAKTTDILTSLVSGLRSQLLDMEERGDTSESEYTKKAELLKSLIELKGKFEGAYTQKVEVSTDFKTRLANQIAASREGPEPVDAAFHTIEPAKGQKSTVADIPESALSTKSLDDVLSTALKKTEKKEAPANES